MTTISNLEPVLTVQVDVDTVRHLRRFYGISDQSESSLDLTYRVALSRFGDLFESLGIRGSFFVVGEDLNDKTHRQMVGQLHAAGHEIANHTTSHPYNFSRLDREEKRREINLAGKAIETATGEKPVGFRAPGYDVSSDTMEILKEAGYLYDSSVLPSILNVPFKVLQLLFSNSGEMSGYGQPALSLAPNHPYRPNFQVIWRQARLGTLWEIPVACVPFIRLPFYANFNLFAGYPLFSFSAALMSGRHCNYVFHAVEMLDPSEVDVSLHRHPNVRVPLKDKMSRCRKFLKRLKEGRCSLPTKDFAAKLGRQDGETKLTQ